MSAVAFGRRLPAALSKPLFGDRERFGKIPDTKDSSWIEWQSRYLDFYLANQRGTIGSVVNRAGYRILAQVDMNGQSVLEVGPADIAHAPWWKGRPEHWTSVDVSSELLDVARRKLDGLGVAHEEVEVEAGGASAMPFPEASFDIVVSFYALEHIHPLDPYLAEIERVLKPGGVLVGAIPCEGGLAWGSGRYVTSRRWLLKHTTIDPDRVICWEHPNFADEILDALERRFTRRVVRLWPLAVPLIDANLVASFIFEKRRT